MSGSGHTTIESRDWVSQPIGQLVWWVLPVVIAMATGVVRWPIRTVAFVWTGAFFWMGIGCLLNAVRCHRLHCYISSPILMIGAAAMALVGTGILSGHALGIVIWTTAGLVMASFVPETLWGKYRAP